MPFFWGFARRGLAGLGFALLLLLGGVRSTESGAMVTAQLPGPAHLVHDFYPGEFDDERPLPQLTRLGNSLFFLANDRATGTAVWRTDGTPGGTRPVPVAATAPSGIVLRGIVGALGERMLLVGSTAEEGAAPLLFAAGQQREAVALGPCAGKYPCLGHDMSPITFAAGGQAFEWIDRDLWHTDGTPEGTRRLRELTRPDPASLSVVDGRLVLGAQNLKGEKRLWATDGTAAGTQALSAGGGDRPFEMQGPAVALGGALITAAARSPVGQLR